jgi:hypothetical protein
MLSSLTTVKLWAFHSINTIRKFITKIFGILNSTHQLGGNFLSRTFTCLYVSFFSPGIRIPFFSRPFLTLLSSCNKIKLRFQVFTAVLLRSQVFWGVILYHGVSCPDASKDFSAFETMGTTSPMMQHHITQNLHHQVNQHYVCLFIC